jgi:WD40 repeat protein
MDDRDLIAATNVALVRALPVSPDGTYLASAGSDGAIRVWNTARGSQRAVLRGHAYRRNCGRDAGCQCPQRSAVTGA